MNFLFALFFLRLSLDNSSLRRLSTGPLPRLRGGAEKSGVDGLEFFGEGGTEDSSEESTDKAGLAERDLGSGVGGRDAMGEGGTEERSEESIDGVGLV